jgi:hypothetical protein
MTDSNSSSAAFGPGYKVVINTGDGRVIRAYFRNDEQNDRALLASRYPLADLLAMCVTEDGSALTLELSQIKAIFFVSSFKGDRDYDPVRFYAAGRHPELIWVEIAFRDGEIVEGCVENSRHHLSSDGFFLIPSSPGGNNQLIYVNKSAIASYRVLGVRDQD